MVTCREVEVYCWQSFSEFWMFVPSGFIYVSHSAFIALPFSMKGILVCFPFLVASWVQDSDVIPIFRLARSVWIVFRCVFRVGWQEEAGWFTFYDEQRSLLPLVLTSSSKYQVGSLRAFSMHYISQFDSRSPSGT
ncbi:hypothetical protein IW261DRAFT_1017361 [Armillaria novae-zelandiae]|uniref:Uncharacterized protein n=1 Tax=Armillaria novae-zelandiae TaxID=153914 RepID=A0AA39NN84_9AGAR|nr:hypothetical protein IW261DRAFT_1017361 [Armillaria novae-zelandiae]